MQPIALSANVFITFIMHACIHVLFGGYTRQAFLEWTGMQRAIHSLHLFQDSGTPQSTDENALINANLLLSWETEI